MKSEAVADKYAHQNPWISLLRIFMCFVVIWDHYTPLEDSLLNKLISHFGSLAVPCFMFLSFFFMSNDIICLDLERIKRRLVRLYVPIFVWNMIYWISQNAYYLAVDRRERLLNIKDLLQSLIFSHSDRLASPLWFLFTQIVILIIMCVLLSFARSDRGRVMVLLAMAVSSYILVYSGVNFDLFNGAVSAVKYPMGRITECIPYAVAGTVLARLSKRQSRWIGFIVTAVCLLLTWPAIRFIPNVNGFGYAGFHLLTGSLAICSFVFSLPIVIKGRFQVVINYIGACTMGIYGLHMLIGRVLSLVATDHRAVATIFPTGTLIFDAEIFVVCLVVSLFIRSINSRLKWCKCQANFYIVR